MISETLNPTISPTAFPTNDPTTAYPTTQPTAGPTTTFETLQWLGWTPDEEGFLSACQGDCDDDDSCADDLICYHNAVPPGCTGTAYSSLSDYCGYGLSMVYRVSRFTPVFTQKRLSFCAKRRFHAVTLSLGRSMIIQLQHRWLS